MYTAVYGIVYDRKRPFTEPITVDLGGGSTDQENLQKLLEIEILDRLIRYVRDFNNEMIDNSVQKLGIGSAAYTQANDTPKAEHIEKTFERVVSND